MLQVRFPHLQFQISVEIEPIGGVDLRQLQAVLGGILRKLQGQHIGSVAMGRHPVRLVKAGVFPDRGVDHVVFRAVCRPLLRGEKHAGIEGPAVDEEVEVGLLQLLIRQGQRPSIGWAPGRVYLLSQTYRLRHRAEPSTTASSRASS